MNPFRPALLFWVCILALLGAATAGAQTPPLVASFEVKPTEPAAGELVTLIDTTTNPAGTQLEYAWDLDADDQFDDGTSMALGGEHRGRGLEVGQGGEHSGELRRLQAAQAGGVERAQVAVEGVDQRAVGEVALELRGPAGEHQHAAAAGVLTQRTQQPRLADPRLARDRDDRRDAGLQLVECPP